MIDFTNIGNLRVAPVPGDIPRYVVPFGMVIPNIGPPSMSIIGLGETSAFIGREIPSPQVPIAITSPDGNGIFFGPITSNRELIETGALIHRLKGNGILIANALISPEVVERWAQAICEELAREAQLSLPTS